MGLALGLGAALAAAAGVAGVLGGMVAWAGPVDLPRDRGMHHRPTPTSGGLAILAGASVGALVFAGLAGGHDSAGLARLAAILGFAGAVGLLGGVDDLFDVGAKTKLLLQVLAALVFGAVVARIEAVPLGGRLSLPLGPILGSLGTALWIVVVTNAVNFMDGANGVAAGALAVALGALGVACLGAGAPLLGGLALAGAAANLGFLAWNVRGKVFQGDVGALFTGFLVSSIAVAAAGANAVGPVGLYFAPIALLPFLTDVLLTLLLRARRRQNLLQAHRDHLFQLWLQQTGRSHAALARRVALVMLGFGLYALLVQRAPAGLQPQLFVVALVAAVFGWRAWRRRLEAMA
jgi:UDP-N-acetylmuramyl pentapeptide phosphotransferase/UDP-N-acetylglucosamine-1-phosphate transferase